MTDTDQGSQAANLGGQLQGGQPQQPPPNPWQTGGGPGPNPWREFVNRIRPPMSLPVQPTGMNTGTPETVPQSDQPQNYIPARMRDSGWGQKDSVLEGAERYPGVTPGPFMPSGPLQIQQTMRASLAGLANIGSGDVSQMAGHSVAWQAAFLKARMQKQEWQARMAREQLLMNNEKLYSTQERELNAYGEAFAKWKDKPDKLYNELYDIARNGAGSGTPDQGMLDMLNDGDHAKGSLAAAKRLLGYRDVHWLNGRKSMQQIKDEAVTQERDRWLPDQPATPTITAPSTTASPGPPAAAAALGPSPTGVPPAVPRAPSDLIRQAAQDQEVGDKKAGPALDPTGEIGDAITDYRNKLDNYARNVPVDPNASFEERRARTMPMIRAANPKLAERVGGLLDGTITPTAAESASPEFATAFEVARRIDPNYSPERAKTRAATLRDFTAGNDGRNLSSIGTAFRHLRGLQKEISSDIPGVWASLFGQSRFDPFTSEETQRKIGALDARVNTALSEYERALIGGKPTQRGREAADQLANWRTLNAATLKSSIDTLVEQLHDRLQEQKDRFVAGAGGKASDMLPLFDRNLGRTDAEGRAGLHEMESDATARASDAAARDWLRKNPNDPRAPAIRKALGM